MQMNVRETAALLGVSDKSIYRWIKQRQLPAFRLNEQYRFNRVEVLAWASSHRVNAPGAVLCEVDEQQTPKVGLAEALRAGGIYYRIGGGDKNSVLQSTVDAIPLPEEVDKAFLLDVLVARETLASTGIGDGVAIPHMRNPIVMYVPRPMVTLCFLENAVEFGALDRKPVHTLFTLVSPTISAHLNLLSRLTFALRNPDFADVVNRQGTREEILASAMSADSGATSAAESIRA